MGASLTVRQTKFSVTTETTTVTIPKAAILEKFGAPEDAEVTVDKYFDSESNACVYITWKEVSYSDSDEGGD